MIENPSPSASFDSTRLSVESQLDSACSRESDAVTAGSLLREARQASGLHIAALAMSLKVPVKKLEALEMDRHDLLPDIVFVRALASSVCRSLKTDPAPVLELLPHFGTPAFSRAPTRVHTSFSKYQPPSKPTSRAAISTPAAIAGVLLVIGAVGLVLLPSIRESLMSSGLAGQAKDAILQVGGRLGMSTSSGGPPDDTDAEPPVLGLNEVAGPKAVISSTSAGGSSVDALAATTGNAVTVVPVLKVSATASAAPAALKGTADTAVEGALVSFTAPSQPSWVKVTDAKGKVVLSRTISPGERIAAAGALPLAVVVGRADAIRVLVRGAAFDLSAYSKENVARFEVK